MPEIITKKDGHIGWLIVDNPSRKNAVTRNMWETIPKKVAELDNDLEIRIIILRGAGDETFISGADISEFAIVRKNAQTARHYEQINADAFAAIQQAKTPTLAMIRQFCFGGGLGLAAACDLRISADNGLFSIPAARLGLGYPVNAMTDILALVGSSKAKELFFTAARLTAEEAKSYGLIDKIAPQHQLESETRAIADMICANAPLTLKAAKATINALRPTLSEAQMSALIAMADECFESNDFAEGRLAFQEKRNPEFKGN